MSEKIITTFVRADRLRLASLFMSTDQTRYYLSGVFIHAADEGVCLVATNGHTLGAFHDQAGFTSASCIVRLPKSLLTAIKETKEREFLWFGIIGDHQGVGRHEARLFDTQKGFCDNLDTAQEAMLNPLLDGVVWSGAVELVDGQFPEYSAVIPERRAKSATSFAFSAKTADPFLKVALDEKSKGLRYFPAGDRDPVLVDCGRDDFVGVLMPFSADVALVDAGNFIRPPEWAMGRRNDLVANLSVATV